jgi:aryl-alcohol dehydrogenase-like predicted oxidoreductase
MALMAYAVLGRGMLTSHAPSIETMAKGDIRNRLPRFQPENAGSNLALSAALEDIARNRGATLAQIAIAWPMARGRALGACIVPIPGAKSRRHLEENVRAAEIELTDRELAEIDRVAPPGAASGTRYPVEHMNRLNV